MISEKRRNLSASCAASCANQMLRKAVKASTVRNPPGPSTGNLMGASTASGTLAVGEAGIDPFPLLKAERLRASLRVDACIAKA